MLSGLSPMFQEWTLQPFIIPHIIILIDYYDNEIYSSINNSGTVSLLLIIKLCVYLRSLDTDLMI